MKKALFFSALWVIGFFFVLGWKPAFTYNAHRYFEIFLLGLLVILGTSQTRLRLQPDRTSYWLIATLVLTGFLSAIFSSQPWMTLRECLTFGLIFVAVGAVAKIRAGMDSKSFDKAALLGIVCLCAGISLIAVNGLVLSFSNGFISRDLIFMAYANVRFFTQLQYVIILLLPAAWLLNRHSASRHWILLTAALSWAVFFMSGSRSGLIALPFAVLVLAICTGKQAWFWIKTLLIQVFSGGLLYAGIRALIAVANVPWVSSSSSFARDIGHGSGRLTIWGNTLQQYLLHPLLGNGPATYACFDTYGIAHPHNFTLVLLSEWGTLVTLLVAVIALRAFWAMVKTVNKAPEQPLLYSLFATIVAVVVTAQLTGIILMPLSQMALILLLGWTWQAYAPQHFIPATTNKTANNLRWVATIALLSLLIAMTHVDLTLQHQAHVNPDGSIRLNNSPRFWVDGYANCQARD